MTPIVTALDADPPHKESVSVGIVQTTLDVETAWPPNQSPPMTDDAADLARVELQRAVAWFGSEMPDFLILPELAMARNDEQVLHDVCKQSGSIVIAGLDYLLDPVNQTAANQAVVLVPPGWPSKGGRGRCQKHTVGKTYPAPTEEKKLRSSVPIHWSFSPDPNLWLFEADRSGRFGVCICYDLMDVERFVLYRGQVHHLFVLAYNQDTTSFTHIAEALCRTLYCNIVVCNTGRYGGSVALSPYYKPFRRPSFRLEGQRLFGVQQVELPLASLDLAWRNGPATPDSDDRLKALPPGFREPQSLTAEERVL